jgi:hypothetical protein
MSAVRCRSAGVRLKARRRTASIASDTLSRTTRERCRDLDLAEEPLVAECGGELGAEHLDRDVAMVLAILGEIDRRHAASADLSLDRVAVRERRAGVREQVDHGPEPPTKAGEAVGVATIAPTVRRGKLSGTTAQVGAALGAPTRPCPPV